MKLNCRIPCIILTVLICNAFLYIIKEKRVKNPLPIEILVMFLCNQAALLYRASPKSFPRKRSSSVISGNPSAKQAIA